MDTRFLCETCGEWKQADEMLTIFFCQSCNKEAEEERARINSEILNSSIRDAMNYFTLGNMTATEAARTKLKPWNTQRRNNLMPKNPLSKKVKVILSVADLILDMRVDGYYIDADGVLYNSTEQCEILTTPEIMVEALRRMK